MWTYFVLGLMIVPIIGVSCLILTVSDAVGKKAKAKAESERKNEEAKISREDLAINRKGKVWEKKSESEDVVLPNREDVDMVEWDSTWQDLYERGWNIFKDFDFLEKYQIPLYAEDYEGCSTKLKQMKERYPKYTFGLFREFEDWMVVARAPSGKPPSKATLYKMAED